MRERELNSGWQLRQEKLHCEAPQHATVAARPEGWLEVERLPCDVHVPLIAAGVIGEPLVADHCFASEWVEKRSWWFRKVFAGDDELLQSHCTELVIEGLDVHADLFLNGEHLGHHASAMYPFRRDVRDLLRPGPNVLVIRLTAGLERWSDLDVAKLGDWVSCEYKRGRGPRGDQRRVLVRKPQYVFGWDWTPRLATCGIMGGARLEAHGGIALREARFTTERLAADRADVRVEVELQNLHPIATTDVAVRVELCFEGAVAVAAEREVFARSGVNFVTFDLAVAAPRLWWPNGMGPQDRYTVRVVARAAGGATDVRQLDCGIRTIALDTDRLDADNRGFAFTVNGVRIFCKGANWVTPDALYGRITDAQYEHLVRQARDAHFNMLRVNGCNAYERDVFYDCCDRYGLLVWQDFLGFSCAAYPDELEWFRLEVEREVDYQTRRLRNHPCLALWCGNNECHAHLAVYHPGGYWAANTQPASPGGMFVYNELMPRLVRSNCPDIPYWNSSPYGGASDLESNHCGDRHHWIFMSADMEERITPEEYDKLACKFVSEFGCIGPPRKSSLRRYHGTAAVDPAGAVWKLHTNTFEKGTLAAAIRKHYADPQGLSLDDYLLYAGLFQGLTLGYALESMRCAPGNQGGLIWSFNDAWGEIGWSIVDYYGVRKIAYPFVKRALEPARLVLRERDGQIAVICLNDSPETLAFELEHGYLSFAGDKLDVGRAAVTVPAFTKAAVVARIPRGPHNPRRGVYYAWPEDGCAIRPAALRSADFRHLEAPPAAVRVTDWRTGEGEVRFTVSSPTYAHAVHFGLADNLPVSDEFFDLLPGESRSISVGVGQAPVRAGDLALRAVQASPLAAAPATV